VLNERCRLAPAGCNFWFPSLASRFERTSDAFESRQQLRHMLLDDVPNLIHKWV
jgi:hypothetical protein